MHILTDIDLRTDPQAHTYIKHEVVTVRFATTPGIIASREGPNSYQPGDALITGSTGDHWSVNRARFDMKYTPLPPLQPGHDGHYRNVPLPVLAKQMHQVFSLRRSRGGDVIHGNVGDWLLQYAPGDYGIVEQLKFAKVYRLRV